MKKTNAIERFSLQELESCRQRLRYFERQKGQAPQAPKALEKWIEIYSERVQKLEKARAKLEKQRQAEQQH